MGWFCRAARRRWYVDLVKAPASWNSIALDTFSSADHSAAGIIEWESRALMVLDDPADADEGLSAEAGKVDLSLSADCLPASNDALDAYGCLPGSSEGRLFSCLEEVDGREGGEGGASPRREVTLLNASGCSHENCAGAKVSWKIKEFLCRVFPRGNENVE